MNPATPPETLPVPNEMIPLNEDAHDEVSNGEPMERKMGAKSSRVGIRLATLLDVFAEAHQAGEVMGADCGYRIFPHAPKLTRYPDVSFVRREKLPDEDLPDGYMETSPDLVVEVVSPYDGAEELEERVLDFLRVGVSLVWVIYPKNRSAHVWRQDGSATHVRETDELNGEAVLPGFSCRLAQLFRRKK